MTPAGGGVELGQGSVRRGWHTMGREDYSVQIVMLRYVSITGTGRADVLDRLTAISQDENSPLQQDPALKSAIDAVKG